MAKVTRQRSTKKKVTKKKVTKKKPTSKTKAKTTTSSKLNLPNSLGIAMYGPGGVGKTSFCANFPNPKFIIGRDRGILDLVDYKQVPEPHSVDQCDSWEDLITYTTEAGTADCETVIFDNLTDMEEMCFHHHCEEYFNGDWSDRGFYSYNKGPKNAAKTDWPELLQLCNDLLDTGKHVIMLAHSKVKNVPNPDGADWLKYEPQLDADVWSRTHYWAKATFFYSLHVETKKDGIRNKAQSQEYNRFLFTQPSPTYEAKNRFGLPSVIDAGSDGGEAFQNFVDAFSID